MLNILNSDIVKDRGIKLDLTDCDSNNMTKIQKLNYRDSLFDLKIGDDDEANINSCNKKNINITIACVNDKGNQTINESKINPEPEKPYKGDCGNNNFEQMLKKLYLTEMLETKKLKHRLIRIYLERKKNKIHNQEFKKASLLAKLTPPSFAQKSFQK